MNSIIKVLAGQKLLVSAFFLTVAYVTIVKGKPKNKNPFENDSRVPKKDYEFDKAKRDAVIKQGYSARKVTQLISENKQNYDAIFIGSGIGSMACAAIMAKAGKKVLVLEQHDQIGGSCHSFIEKGFEFDPGVHVIGEMRNNTAVRFLFDQITDGQLEWADLPDDYDTIVLVDSKDNDSTQTGGQCIKTIETHIAENTKLPSLQLSYRSGKQETIDSLLACFPQEEKVIKKYFDLLSECRKSSLHYIAFKFMPRFLRKFLVSTGLIHWFTSFFKNWTVKSLTQVLNEIAPHNPTLRAALSYNFGDYGTLPKDTPFFMHAFLQNHFLYGGSYPVNGSSEIAYTIVPVIEKSGGKCLVRAEVESIIVSESGKAIGVRMKAKQDMKPFQIYSSTIISNAGFYNTQTLLNNNNNEIKQNNTELIKNVNEHVRNGMGGFTVYVGLNGTPEELGVEGRNYWAFWSKKGEEDLDKVCEDYMDRNQWDISSGPVPLLFISFPSAKDPLSEKKNPGKCTATVVTVANYKWFENWEDDRIMHRGEDYESRKKELGELIWKQTLALFPQLKNRVEYFDIGTPITNKYYLRASKGEMYGLDHTIQRFSAKCSASLGCETDITNLYLTGQDAFTCGIVGGAFGGLLCASKVLNRNIYQDLKNLKDKSKKSISTTA